MKKATYCISLLFVFFIWTTGTGGVGKISAIPIAMIWILTLCFQQRVRRLHLFHWLFLAFVVWNVICLIWSYDPISSIIENARYIGFFLCTVMIWDNYRTERQCRALVQTLVLGSYILVAITVIFYKLGITARQDSERFTAFGYDVNELGLTLSLMMPLAWHLQFDKPTKHRFLALANYAYPLIAMIGILLSGSRAALVATLPTLIYLGWNIRRLPFTWKLGLVMITVFIIGFLSTLDISYQLGRFAKLHQSASSDKLSGRLVLWSAGWDLFMKQPLQGVGTGAFSEATKPYGTQKNPLTGIPMVAHNSYLSVLTETGIIGFGLFFAILCTVLSRILHMEKRERAAWLAAFLTLTISIFSITHEKYLQTWLLFTFILVSSYSDALETDNSTMKTGVVQSRQQRAIWDLTHQEIH